MGWGGRFRLILTMKSWGNMMNEEMLLTNIYVRSRVFSGLIHSACGLSCWCFSVTGEKLFFSTCPDEQEFLLFLRSSGCLDYATGEQVRRDRPVILSDSIGIIWGAEYMWKNGAPEELIMIGPIFNSSSSFRSIETALHRLTLSQQARNMLLEKMKKIPVLSMANFGQYVQMLHYMLFQEEIQRQEFQFQTVIEDGKNIYRHLGDELDADGGGTVPAPEKRPDDFLRAMHPRRDSGRHAPADRIRDGNGALRSPGARCHHDGVADGQSPHDGGLHPQGA